MKRSWRAWRRAGRFLKTALPTIGLVLVAAAIGMSFAGYRVSHPAAVAEAVNPSHYLLTASEVTWTSRDGLRLSGDWIPGIAGAPAIVLATGYGMSRSDGLSLAAALHGAGFNVLLYPQRGCGSKPRGASWLGLRETGDLEAALDLLEHRTDIDRSRMGVWGVDVGARAALAAAATRPKVRVIVADCPYREIDEFLAVRLEEDLGVSSPILRRIAAWGLGVTELLAAGDPGFVPAEALADRDIMVLAGENRPGMLAHAIDVHNRIRPAKTLVTLQACRVRLMAGEALTSYDSTVSGFFQQHLGKQGAGAQPGKQN